MIAPAPIRDETKRRLQKLTWSAITRLALSFVGAAGARLGESFVDWLLQREDEGDGDDDGDDVCKPQVEDNK